MVFIITGAAPRGFGVSGVVLLINKREPRMSADRNPHAGRKRILFMDDEEMLRSVVSRMLEIMGYDVETASGGAEAVQVYRSAFERGAGFDAVILDLVVRDGMGGKEAIEKILEIDPDAAVLISSGYVGDPIMRDYARYGFQGVIAKPYTSDELRENLGRVLSPGIPT